MTIKKEVAAKNINAKNTIAPAVFVMTR